MAENLPEFPRTTRATDDGPDRVYVGSYWGSRGESVEQCAARVARCLQGLHSIDPCFADWRTAGRGDKPVYKERAQFDVSTTKRLVLAGRARKEDSGEVDTVLGTHVSLYSLVNDGVVTFSANFGMSSRWVPNTCLVQPPLSGELAKRVIRGDKLRAILELVIACFDPDRGGVYSTEVRDLMPTPPGKTNIGWMLYRRSGFSSETQLPKECRIVPTQSGGEILILTDELFTAKNPRHVEIAWQVANAIGLEVTDNRGTLLYREAPPVPPEKDFRGASDEPDEGAGREPAAK